MPRFIFCLLFLALAASAAQAINNTTAVPAGRERLLRIFNWSDYIDPTVLVDFSRTSGVVPLYNEYDDNSILDARLTRGQADFDLVSPTATPYMERQINAGLYQPLDKNKIPNLKNLDPKLMQLVQGADPDNAHAIIYQWGTTGILFNAALVKKVLPNAKLDSLDLLFNPESMKELKKCGVTMLDSPSEVMPLVFRYLGHDPSTSKPEDHIDAEALMRRVRPYVKYFHSSRYVDDLATGKICVALGWNGDANLANTQAAELGTGQTIGYAIPHEGTVVWFDMMAIPKTAKNTHAAHLFLNYILQPEVMARISNKTGYANAVPAARAYLDDELNHNGVAYPSDQVMSKLFSIGGTSDQHARALQQIWTRMRVSSLTEPAPPLAAKPLH